MCMRSGYHALAWQCYPYLHHNEYASPQPSEIWPGFKQIWLLYCWQVQLALQRLDWSEAGLLGLYKRGSQNGNKANFSVASALGRLASGGGLDSLPLGSSGSGTLVGAPSTAISASPDSSFSPSLKGWRKARKMRSSRFLNAYGKCRGGWGGRACCACWSMNSWLGAFHQGLNGCRYLLAGMILCVV